MMIHTDDTNSKFFSFFAPLTIVPSVFILCSVFCASFLVLDFYEFYWFFLVCSPLYLLLFVGWWLYLLDLRVALLQDISNYQGFCPISVPQFSKLLLNSWRQKIQLPLPGPDCGYGRNPSGWFSWGTSIVPPYWWCWGELDVLEAPNSYCWGLYNKS